MLYAGPICCGGFVPLALLFAFLIALNYLLQIRKEVFMGHFYNSNFFKLFTENLFVNSLFTTIWAIGTSVAAAGVQIKTGLKNNHYS
jgi:hypothetical protein